MGRWGSFAKSFWAPYVRVADRRAAAAKEVEKLRKKGEQTQPVVVAGRAIATTFWGKGWCNAIEHHADWYNRLDRGRTYARNGSVVDLRIGAGAVDALVSGSELYTVRITIAPLGDARWQRLAAACAGKVASLVELLQGRLDKATLGRLCDPADGLFPLPQEMTFACSCPDSARLCKHVAAALYGVGNRLDSAPELLFVLRNVDQAALLTEAGAVALGGAGDADALGSDDDLAAIFGVEFGGDLEGLGDPVAAPRATAAPRVATAPKTRGRAHRSLARSPAQPATEVVVARPVGGRKPRKAAPPAQGLSKAQAALLAALARQPEEMWSLEALLMVDVSLTVSAVRGELVALEAAGLVTRVVEADGEAYWYATAAGQAV